MTNVDFDYEKVSTLVKLALVEDIGTGDITSEVTVPPGMTGRLRFIARHKTVVAGLALLEPLYREISRQVGCELLVADGDVVRAGQLLATASGPVRALLAGERVALNFLQQLSGIATLSARFVKAVAGTDVEIFDTRKTTPGLRLLQKYAVRVGGGHNHRMGLYDQILIKDNHLECLSRRDDVESLADFVKWLRGRVPGTIIEVEVEDLAKLDETLAAKVDVVLLDNMSCEQLEEAVGKARLKRKVPILECSGGVTLTNVAEIARTGVDRISIGRLTHSAPAADISADIDGITDAEEHEENT